ncbi:MAG: hypothetical protein IPO92_16135 [Saprospiraceae bacterium]|nr:hypothetical protein [Saprospiraceae bacterium]
MKLHLNPFLKTIIVLLLAFATILPSSYAQSVGIGTLTPMPMQHWM